MWNVVGKQMPQLRSLKLKLESLRPWPQCTCEHVDTIISAPKTLVRGLQHFELELTVPSGDDEIMYDSTLIERDIREAVCRPASIVEG
jgi:hypothetical protein